MLLGSPPDMVHSTLLHRVCPHDPGHSILLIIHYIPEKIKWFLDFFGKRYYKSNFPPAKSNVAK